MTTEYKTKESNADYDLEKRIEGLDLKEEAKGGRAIAYHYVHNHKTASSIARDKKLLGNLCDDDRLGEEYGLRVYVTEVAPEEGMEKIVAGTGLYEPKYGLEVMIPKSYLHPGNKIPMLPRSYRIRLPRGKDGIDVIVLRTWNLSKVQKKKLIVRSLTTTFASYV